MYTTLEVVGPEHELSINDEDLNPLPISDEVIKKLYGRIVTKVKLNNFIIGKELQAHVLEFKAIEPFSDPEVFNETMYNAVLQLSELLKTKFNAHLLGLGMHPFLKLENTKVWSHRDIRIYRALDRIFDLQQHGWLNIQSFQINLPYSSEKDAIKIYNRISSILPYIPAISASSPIVESKVGKFIDNRLYFYMINQKNIPSITGNVIPRYITSFRDYKENIIQKFFNDLRKLKAPDCIMKKWLDSRGEIFKFGRNAIEIRVIDEQECIKSDVAIACFIKSLVLGLMKDDSYNKLPHNILVEDFKKVIKYGLDAKTKYGDTVKSICLHLYRIAKNNCTYKEKKYLKIIKKRIRGGSISNLILKKIDKKSKKTDIQNAIFSVYLTLEKNLEKNKIFQ